MVEEPGLPYYLPIAEGRIIGFIPFPRVLVLCEMQSVKSRILTRVAVSIQIEMVKIPFFLLQVGCLVVWFLWHITVYSIFNTGSLV